jgi:Protein of unknown function (DUF3443)
MNASRLWMALGLCVALAACGGGGGGSGSGSGNASANPPAQQNPPILQGSTSITQVIASPGPNTAAISVAAAPAATNVVVANVPFVSVTVCLAGTATCATIDKIQLDTGSSGFRVLSSALDAALPGLSTALTPTAPPSGAPGAQLGECMVFADGVAFGGIRKADLTIGSEKAAGINIEVIADAATPQPTAGNGGTSGNPTTQTQLDFCASTANQDTPQDLHANGVLGVGVTPTDCNACATGSNISPMYYSCAAASCSPILATPLATSFQVPNPVTKLPIDNNGVIVELPPVPDGGAPSVNGMLVFGIGTQTNNTLGTAQVMTTDNSGDLTTVFNGTSYPKSFFDSGSNSLFFPSSIPTCTDATSFYCPSSTQSLSAIMQGTNGINATINFSIANTDTLTNSGNFAFDNQGGSSTTFFPQGKTFDWGLPAFYGRNVFTAIIGQTTPGGAVGPYYAF